MISLSTIKSGLYTWASTTSGLATIWSDQNAPQPDKPYLTLRIQGISSIGHDSLQAPEDTGATGGVIGDREFVLFVQGFGDGVLSKLDALRTSLT